MENRFLAAGKPIAFFHCYASLFFVWGGGGEAAKATQQLLSRLLQKWACAPPYSHPPAPTDLSTPVPIVPLAQSLFKEKANWERMGWSPRIINAAPMHISTLTVIVSQWHNAVGEGKKERGKGKKKRRQTQEGGRENKADRTIRQSWTGGKECRVGDPERCWRRQVQSPSAAC